MSRIYKFRAWDFKTKEMHHWNTGFNYRWFECQDNKDCHALMQYTGLKDKNGVEIYEGDILKHYAAGYHIGNFAVQWDDKGFWDYGIDNETSEVIGNIYSNPELLKETN